MALENRALAAQPPNCEFIIHDEYWGPGCRTFFRFLGDAMARPGGLFSKEPARPTPNLSNRCVAGNSTLPGL